MLKSFCFDQNTPHAQVVRRQLQFHCRRPSSRQNVFLSRPPQTPSTGGRFSTPRETCRSAKRCNHAASTRNASSRAMSKSPAHRRLSKRYAQNGQIVNHLASPLSSRLSRFLRPPTRRSPSARWRSSSRLQLRRSSSLVKIRHLRLFVHRAADPVTDKFPHHAEIRFAQHTAAPPAKYPHAITRLRLRDAQIQATVPSRPSTVAPPHPQPPTATVRPCRR
jgi:hypothetical protein